MPPTTLETIDLALKQVNQNMATKDEVKQLVIDYAKDEAVKAQFVSAEQHDKEKAEYQASINSMAKQLKALSSMHFATDSSYEGSFGSLDRAKAFGMFVMATMLGNEAAKSYCDDMGIEMKKTMTTSDGNSTGGVFIPETVSTDIIQMVGNYGLYRQKAMIYPLGPGGNIMPKQTTDPIVYCPGEGVTISASDLNFTGLPLRKQGWKALVAFSNELGTAAAAAIGELLGPSFARAFAKKEDACGFVGDGTEAYFNNIGIVAALRAAATAIGSCPGLTVQGTAGDWTKIETDDFMNVIANHPGEYDNEDTEFYCSKKFYYGVMLATALVSGNASLKEELLRTGYTRDPSYQGYKVNYVASMPKVKPSKDHCPVILGNLPLGSILGDRGQLSIAQSKEVGFKDDMTWVRATEEVAVNNHGAYNLEGTTKVAGALTGLWADVA